MGKARKPPIPMIGSEERLVEMSVEQANWLLQRTLGVIIPDALCDLRKIAKDEICIAKHETDALWADLYEQSPIAQERKDDRRIQIFGKREHIEEIQEDGETNYKYKDDTARVNVRLSANGIRGACWILFIWLHPPVTTKDGKRIGASVTAMEAHEICWPIARAIRKEKAIRELLGLNKERKDRWPKSDPPKIVAPAEEGVA